jgi:hypothetical protein
MPGPRWIAGLLVATVAVVLVRWGDAPEGGASPAFGQDAGPAAVSTTPGAADGEAASERTTSATIANPFSTFQHVPNGGSAAPPAQLAEPPPLPSVPPVRPVEAEIARTAPPPPPEPSESDTEPEN